MFLQENDFDYSDMARKQRKDEEIMRLFHQQDGNSLVSDEFKGIGTDDLLLCDTLPTTSGRLFLKTTVLKFSIAFTNSPTVAQ